MHHEVSGTEGLYNLTDRGFGLAAVTHQQVGSGQTGGCESCCCCCPFWSPLPCESLVADALIDGDYVPYDKVALMGGGVT